MPNPITDNRARRVSFYDQIEYKPSVWSLVNKINLTDDLPLYFLAR